MKSREDPEDGTQRNCDPHGHPPGGVGKRGLLVCDAKYVTTAGSKARVNHVKRGRLDLP